MPESAQLITQASKCGRERTENNTETETKRQRDRERYTETDQKERQRDAEKHTDPSRHLLHNLALSWWYSLVRQGRPLKFVVALDSHSS